MNRDHNRIISSWAATIRRAIELGKDDAVYRLTRAFVQRLRELLDVERESARLTAAYARTTRLKTGVQRRHVADSHREDAPADAV